MRLDERCMAPSVAGHTMKYYSQSLSTNCFTSSPHHHQFLVIQFTVRELMLIGFHYISVTDHWSNMPTYSANLSSYHTSFIPVTALEHILSSSSSSQVID